MSSPLEHESARQFDAMITALDRDMRRQGVTVPDLAAKQAVNTAYQALAASLDAHEAEHGPPSPELRDAVTRHLGRWLFRSRYFARAFQKPHGYPGDFRMLEWMYDLADDPCADATQPGIVNCLDYVYSQLDPTQLLPARRSWLVELLRREAASRSGVLRVLDVAAGGARYLADFMGEVDPSRVELTLVDQDASALAYCRTVSLAPWADRLETISVPIRKLPTLLREGKFDVILSAGLLDYLPDAESRELLAFLDSRLADDGVIGVTNVHHSDNSRTARLWVVDWPLILRDEAELAALFPVSHEVTTSIASRGALTLAAARPKRSCARSS